MSELRWGLLSGFLRVMKSRCVVAPPVLNDIARFA